MHKGCGWYGRKINAHPLLDGLQWELMVEWMEQYWLNDCKIYGEMLCSIFVLSDFVKYIVISFKMFSIEIEFAMSISYLGQWETACNIIWLCNMIPLTKGQQCGKCFHATMSSCVLNTIMPAAEKDTFNHALRMQLIWKGNQCTPIVRQVRAWVNRWLEGTVWAQQVGDLLWNIFYIMGISSHIALLFVLILLISSDFANVLAHSTRVIIRVNMSVPNFMIT